MTAETDQEGTILERLTTVRGRVLDRLDELTAAPYHEGAEGITIASRELVNVAQAFESVDRAIAARGAGDVGPGAQLDVDQLATAVWNAASDAGAPTPAADAAVSALHAAARGQRQAG